MKRNINSLFLFKFMNSKINEKFEFCIKRFMIKLNKSRDKLFIFSGLVFLRNIKIFQQFKFQYPFF